MADFELTEKRSKFIACAEPASSEDNAKTSISEVRARFRDARHVVWAYILPDGTERYSDDGEPQGTAGLPVMELLRRANIRGILVTVTRYFGGILLGPGGLKRAYSDAASGALKNVQLLENTIKQRVTIVIPYTLASKIKHEIVSAGAVIEDTVYTDTVRLTVLTDFDKFTQLRGLINDISSGGAEITDSGPAVVIINR